MKAITKPQSNPIASWSHSRYASSVSLPDTPARHQNHANVATFKQNILVSHILQIQLINYMWDSYITKTENDNQNRCDKIQVQKEEIEYSHDIDYNIVREHHLQRTLSKVVADYIDKILVIDL